MLTRPAKPEPTAPAAPAAPGSDTFVTFEIGAQTFGVGVAWVREILDIGAIHRLPNAPPACEGVIDARGASVPVISLGARLGVPVGDRGPDTRIIVLQRGGQDEGGPIGVLADRVLNVCRIPHTEIEMPPTAFDLRSTGQGLLGIARIDGRFTLLLDIAAVLEPTAGLG